MGKNRPLVENSPVKNLPPIPRSPCHVLSYATDGHRNRCSGQENKHGGLFKSWLKNKSSVANYIGMIVALLSLRITETWFAPWDSMVSIQSQCQICFLEVNHGWAIMKPPQRGPVKTMIKRREELWIRFHQRQRKWKSWRNRNKASDVMFCELQWKHKNPI